MRINSNNIAKMFPVGKEFPVSLYSIVGKYYLLPIQKSRELPKIRKEK
jgi:hypothetical protein